MYTAPRERCQRRRAAARWCSADIVVRTLPSEACKSRPDLWAECVVGATTQADYISLFRGAGFEDVGVLHRLDYFSGSASAETRRGGGPVWGRGDRAAGHQVI